MDIGAGTGSVLLLQYTIGINFEFMLPWHYDKVA
jgi:hypothetical protein